MFAELASVSFLCLDLPMTSIHRFVKLIPPRLSDYGDYLAICFME